MCRQAQNHEFFQETRAQLISFCPILTRPKKPTCFKAINPFTGAVCKSRNVINTPHQVPTSILGVGLHKSHCDGFIEYKGNSWCLMKSVHYRALGCNCVRCYTSHCSTSLGPGQLLCVCKSLGGSGTRPEWWIFLRHPKGHVLCFLRHTGA